MEEELGRELTSREIVHHINGDHFDNRIENLQLCSNQQEHQCLHSGKDLEKWLEECRQQTFAQAIQYLNKPKKIGLAWVKKL